jgi:protein ImuA
MQANTTQRTEVARLQRQILAWQGYKEKDETSKSLGLGLLEHAFPGQTFPLSCIHEFIADKQEDEAATSGFIGGLLATLLQQGGVCIWIGSTQQLYAPALKTFGVAPEQVIFIRMQREKDILWALEESLKCADIQVVVAEIQDLDFIQSRRLQLAVEKSKVTGLLLRTAVRQHMATACAARWQVRSLPSTVVDGLPGVGFPLWSVDLLKVRNGNPGSWEVGWQRGQFTLAHKEVNVEQQRVVDLKVG